MKIRALVAKCDGQGGDSPLAPGSIEPTMVPVTRDFDPRLPPIGSAVLSIDGTDVWADIELFTDASVAGLYPALAGRYTGFEKQHAFRSGTITKFEIVTVSLNKQPNVDERIGPIGFSNFLDRAQVEKLLGQ